MSGFLQPSLPVLVLLGLGFVACGWGLSSLVLRRQIGKRLALEDIRNEMEVRKSVFTILGAVTVVLTVAFSVAELSVKRAAEDRQQLYAALGQLSAETARPETSAAALLQLDRLGAASPEQKPALVRVVNAYLTRHAADPVSEHDASDLARPDIEVAFNVLASLVGPDVKLGALVRLKDLDLRHLRAPEATLPHARLVNVRLSGGNLDGADFSGAELTGVEMERGSFADVILDGARLTGVRLQYSNVEGTDFCRASERGVVLDARWNWDPGRC